MMAETGNGLTMEITIPKDRYDQLIRFEERVCVAVERICNDDLCNAEEVLCILGEKLSLQRTKEIKENLKRIEARK